MTIRNHLPLCLLLAISMLACALCIAAVEDEKYRQEKERITYIATAQAGKIQFVLHTALQKTLTLKMLVLQGKGNVPEFESLARELVDNGVINSLQLAPDGVVTQVYPREGNEEAYGDIFAVPARATEAILARDTGKLTMSGPFPLAQGGFGVVGRQPIYFPDEHGKSIFWGFSIIVLMVPEVFAPAELNLLEKEGFAWQLHRIHPDTKEVQVFASSPQADTTELPDPVDISFAVPNTTWTLSVSPRNGWINLPALTLEILVGGLISVLLTLLGSSLFSLNAQKKVLQSLALTDTLTGLYNRRQLSEYLKRQCGDLTTPFMLCYMDLNDFKQINDSFGHAQGDIYLRECARRFQVCLDEEDTLFRIGGDEFVALLKKTPNGKTCEEKAELLAKIMTAPVLLAGRTASGSLSIGCAVFPCEATTGEALLNKADARMYQVKMQQKHHNTNQIQPC